MMKSKNYLYPLFFLMTLAPAVGLATVDSSSIGRLNTSPAPDQAYVLASGQYGPNGLGVGTTSLVATVSNTCISPTVPDLKFSFGGWTFTYSCAAQGFSTTKRNGPAWITAAPGGGYNVYVNTVLFESGDCSNQRAYVVYWQINCVPSGTSYPINGLKANDGGNCTGSNGMCGANG